MSACDRSMSGLVDIAYSGALIQAAILSRMFCEIYADIASQALPAVRSHCFSQRATLTNRQKFILKPYNSEDLWHKKGRKHQNPYDCED